MALLYTFGLLILIALIALFVDKVAPFRKEKNAEEKRRQFIG